MRERNKSTEIRAKKCTGEMHRDKERNGEREPVCVCVCVCVAVGLQLSSG